MKENPTLTLVDSHAHLSMKDFKSLFMFEIKNLRC